MKTITEYQPLIFSRILDSAEREKSAFHFRSFHPALTALEVVAGFWFIADTGFMPWTWQFWMVFGPLFMAGELAAHMLAPK